MQWFHRNPLKAASKLDFDLGLVIKSINARKLASDTTIHRAKLLILLRNPDNDIKVILDAFQLYIDGVYGYVYEYCEGEPGTKSESKIRFTKHIRWSNSTDLRRTEPETHVDFLFEWVSMLMNVAFWFSKKAAKISTNENISESEAKDVHKCLKYAAGLIKLCKDELYPQLVVLLPKESDGDPNILDAYIYQFSAEAQEVVMAQAIEKEHDATLISKLAFNTAASYDKAYLSLYGYDLNKVGKWKIYCQFKKYCYSAYAHAYHVMVLLKQDAGGEGIACAKKAKEIYDEAIMAAREYAKANGVGLTVKPADHMFFKNLGPLIEKHRRRAQDENAMM